MSLKSMLTNKTRTMLTVLGMVIGIAAVIVVFSAGEGISGLVLGQVKSFGTDFVQIEVKVPNNKKGQAGISQSSQAIAQGVQVTSLKLTDEDKIDRLPNVKASYSAVQSQDQVSYSDQLRRAILYGVSGSYLNIDSGEVAAGQFFTTEDDKSLAQVAVLGSTIKDKLFGDSDPIGRYITIHKLKFRVVGVMKKRGSSGFISLDDFIFLPVRTQQKKIMGIDHVFAIIAKLNDMSKADSTVADMTDIIRQDHNITDPNKDDFRISTMAELLSTLDTITSALTFLLLAIVAISLLVGGVGIMNIMYVVVTERTAEIGLRKAVGAKFNDIMKQFLVEAVLITLLGGIIGIVIGAGISGLIAVVATKFLNLQWEFIIPPKAYITSIIFSIICGVVFGVYPARKAAHLDPIEALRSE